MDKEIIKKDLPVEDICFMCDRHLEPKEIYFKLLRKDDVTQTKKLPYVFCEPCTDILDKAISDQKEKPHKKIRHS